MPRIILQDDVRPLVVDDSYTIKKAIEKVREQKKLRKKKERLEKSRKRKNKK